MARYVCPMCGYVYDEEHEGRPLDPNGTCPLCATSFSAFVSADGETDAPSISEFVAARKADERN